MGQERPLLPVWPTTSESCRRSSASGLPVGCGAQASARNRRGRLRSDPDQCASARCTRPPGIPAAGITDDRGHDDICPPERDVQKNEQLPARTPPKKRQEPRRNMMHYVGCSRPSGHRHSTLRIAAGPLERSAGPLRAGRNSAKSQSPRTGANMHIAEGNDLRHDRRKRAAYVAARCPGTHRRRVCSTGGGERCGLSRVCGHPERASCPPTSGRMQLSLRAEELGHCHPVQQVDVFPDCRSLDPAGRSGIIRGRACRCDDSNPPL